MIGIEQWMQTPEGINVSLVEIGDREASAVEAAGPDGGRWAEFDNGDAFRDFHYTVQAGTGLRLRAVATSSDATDYALVFAQVDGGTLTEISTTPIEISGDEGDTIVVTIGFLILRWNTVANPFISYRIGVSASSAAAWEG